MTSRKISTLSTEAESLIARFEADWLAGKRPDLAAVLDASPVEERPAVFRELAHTDLGFRLKAGEEVAAADYLARYPDLIDDPTVSVTLATAKARFRAEDQVSATTCHRDDTGHCRRPRQVAES